MFPLLELKPILLCFAISWMVSFFFLGLTIRLSSKIDDIIIFILLLFIYGFVYIIPLPLDMDMDSKKLRVLLILGGSSSILYVIEAKSVKSKIFLFNSFLLSTLYVCLYLKKIYVTIGIIFLFLTIFLFPIDIVFLSIFIVRSFSFDEWGLALFMQVSFLFWLKKCNEKSFLFIYLIFMMIITFFIPEKSIMIAKYFLSPLSGALAIYFIYIARTGKEHWVTFMLYVCNGILISLLLKKAEAAYYFILLNIFLLFISAFATYMHLRVDKKPLSGFPTEFINLVYSEKRPYLIQYYGVLMVMATFYSCEESWMTHWTFSLLLQLGFIQFFGFFIKKLN